MRGVGFEYLFELIRNLILFRCIFKWYFCVAFYSINACICLFHSKQNNLIENTRENLSLKTTKKERNQIFEKVHKSLLRFYSRLLILFAVSIFCEFNIQTQFIEMNVFHIN